MHTSRRHYDQVHPGHEPRIFEPWPSLPAFRDVSADDLILIARGLELLTHTRAGIKYPSVISFSLLKAEVSKKKKVV